jgi:phosphohistidine phosphatase SixA
MQLLLIRHALPLRTEVGEGADPELTDAGWEQARRLPDALSRFPISRLISSPQRRALQTAEILADALPNRPPVEVVDALAPASDWQALVEWTADQDAARIAWVGHMPCVARLVALTIGDGSAAIRMQKGAVASIRLDDGPGQPGELEWLATDAIL